MILNLALIGYFKYADFFAQNIAAIFGASWHTKNIFLPLGISFFTFQQIACLVDTYKGKIGRLSLYRYALFVSFFPQLIAGPIVLADTLIPQFDNKRIFCLSYKNLCIGITLFSIGLFKKVVIADTFSPWVAAAFGADHALTFIEAWGGALSYTFQIYFDFSGYSDMALGLGRFFNIELPINFNSPYKAASITDFWRRWHITLSGFLKEYLYIPLGGNRRGKLRRYINLMLTMLLGGLWHGAGWTFVIWGGLHGLFLTINHLWREHKPFDIPKPISHLITFVCIVIAWVFFRADNVAQATEILKGMAGMNIQTLTESAYTPGRYAKGIFIIAAVMLYAPTSGTIANRLLHSDHLHIAAVITGIIITVALMSLGNISEFLYFQF
ncbi:MAG: MBOAT family O-acyltransferase [Synergistes sp.]|nr:MBOAT family O-acyltransferase [Synergistes sp.]